MADKNTSIIRKLYSLVINVIFGLRTQLIAPYFTLTFIIALIGIFIVTRLVTDSVEDRFDNLIIESSRVAADGIAAQEQSHLENLRLMVFTMGVPEKMLAKDAAALTELLQPIIINGSIQSVSIIDPEGIEIISIIQDPVSGDYLTSMGGNPSSLEAISKPLNREIDDFGDKFSTMEQTIYGTYLMTSAPVVTAESQFVGVMVIGTNLNSLVRDIKGQALADTLILDFDGSLLAFTRPLESGSENVTLTQEEISKLTPSYSKSLDLSQREFKVYYSPLVLRQRVVGVLGVALPTNFVVSATSTSRNTLAIVFTCGTLSMIVIGLILAYSISRPILKLRDASLAVAAGDLDKRSGLKRRDEIGQLASSFDTMVSQLGERTQELVQSEKLSAVGQLAAGIAHDVKNPLAVIKGLSEEMQEDFVGDTNIISQLNIIQDSADRANIIISDLMKFSRQSEFTKETQNICNTVESAIRLTEYLARKGNVAVEAIKSHDEIVVSYDPQQIEQVLINLIQNAIQAMSNGGSLTIMVDSQYPWAIIKVQDTGTGIPKENLQRIFDPFFTTKPVGEGTGLGLSVTYGIIKKHDGDIKVQSKVGSGTVFTIRLPMQNTLT